MSRKNRPSAVVLFLLFASLFAGCERSAPKAEADGVKSIATSDTILSGMCQSLLPAGFFTVAAILPPGQCPGHYDIKLSDLVKVKEADLVVSFIDMPFMQRTDMDADRELLIDAQDRNWMAPPSYIAGLNILADRLAQRFPAFKRQIDIGRERAVQKVTETGGDLGDTMQRAGVSRSAVIGSSMLREPLQWMGLRVVGEYGRPESISAKEIVSLIRIGREEKVAMILDNLQSGPEAGKGIAEALGVPHVIFSNFPSEEGYAATLRDNVDAVLAALKTK
ncbi:MAG: zinc ABC transporter substrate-binding protein [Acidobacteria bacterium]|nr:zinc ABC transporter substrate-binding protein [Acidobacteriota bacterium]